MLKTKICYFSTEPAHKGALGCTEIAAPVLQKTAGGLLLSGGTTQSIQEAVIGKLLAVGEDVEIKVQVGDSVIFSKYSTTDVKVPDGDICFVAQKSIMATLS